MATDGAPRAAAVEASPQAREGGPVSGEAGVSPLVAVGRIGSLGTNLPRSPPEGFRPGPAP